jgi:hypothetical protein
VTGTLPSPVSFPPLLLWTDRSRSCDLDRSTYRRGILQSDPSEPL